VRLLDLGPGEAFVHAITGKRVRYPASRSTQQWFVKLLMRMSPAQLATKTVGKGVFDFVGLQPSVRSFLGRTGPKFVVAPDYKTIRRQLRLSLRRVHRSVRCWYHFRDPSEPVIHYDVASSCIASCRPEIRKLLEPDDRDDDMNDKKRKQALIRALDKSKWLDSLPAHVKQFYWRCSDKTWMPNRAEEEYHRKRNMPGPVEAWLMEASLLIYKSYTETRDLFTSNLNTRDLRCWRLLRSMKDDIYLRPPDKFSATVVVPKASYVRDVQAHLSQDQYYTPAESIPWRIIFNHWSAMHKPLEIRIEERDDLSYELKRLLRYLDQTFYEERASPRPRCNRFFGLYKLHKVTLPATDLHLHDTSSIPIRPVISCTHDFRRFGFVWLAQLLQPIVCNLWGVATSTKGVVQRLEGQKVDEEDWLVAVDIKEFYLNIESEYCFKVVSNILHGMDLHPLVFRTAQSILKSMLTYMYFEFDGRIYKQKKGIFMGNQAAVQIANLIAWHLEFNEKHLPNFAEIRFYSRFLDDGLMIWSGDERSLTLWLTYMNAPVRGKWGFCNLQYTMAYDRRSAVYLDLTVSKGNRFTSFGILDMELYTKPGNPYCFLPRGSCHHPFVFEAWVKAEVIRRLIVSSSQEAFVNACRIFGSMLLERGYSGAFVRRKLCEHTFADRDRILFGGTTDDDERAKIRERSRTLPFIRMFHGAMPNCSWLHEHMHAHIGDVCPLQLRESYTVATNIMRTMWKHC